MNTKELFEMMEKMSLKLDAFFHTRIQSIDILKADAEAMKREFVQLTMLEACKCVDRKLEKNHSLEKIIWFAAIDVWHDSIRRNKRYYFETSRLGSFTEVPVTVSEQKQFESSDFVNRVLNSIDFKNNERDMYEMYLQNYSYKEMALVFDSTPGAIKQKIYNLNNKVRATVKK